MYLRLIGAALVAAAIGGSLWYVHSLKSEITDKETEISTLTSRIAVTESKLKDQNAAVQAMADAASANAATHAKELQQAKAEASKGRAAAAVIYKIQPSVPNDDLKSTLDLLNGVSAAASGVKP
jgi:predicted  nucleic acid-binding Zn-ribbon protein